MEFNPELPQVDDLLSLFLNDVPMLDVRAPVEFAEGAFPGAINQPLINDDERQRIGKTYKEQGQDKAVQLGLKLVAGELKQQRVQGWETFARQHPQGVLYCFRGGMRSRISQQWLYEHTGVHYPRVRGGYKRMRRFLIDQLEQNASKIHPVVVGGRTGTGKTRLLNRLTPHLDLEAIAWHRGSAFGRHATPQPSQINFENTLSIAVLKLLHHNNPWFVTEDESRNIGARHMPMRFFQALSEAPVVVLHASLDERIEVTLQEYVVDALAEHQSLRGDAQGFEDWASSLRNSLYRIRKRLGGVLYQDTLSKLDQALKQHQTQQSLEGHRSWISSLLKDYYDSMYNYQLSSKAERIVYQGNAADVIDYLGTHCAIHCLR